MTVTILESSEIEGEKHRYRLQEQQTKAGKLSEEEAPLVKDEKSGRLRALKLWINRRMWKQNTDIRSPLTTAGMSGKKEFHFSHRWATGKKVVQENTPGNNGRDPTRTSKSIRSRGGNRARRSSGPNERVAGACSDVQVLLMAEFYITSSSSWSFSTLPHKVGSRPGTQVSRPAWYQSVELQ